MLDQASRISKLFPLAVLISVSAGAREYGPPEGARMPNVELRDQDGKAHSLSNLLGPAGALIVFYRSVVWCPFCKAFLVELERNSAEFDKLGMKVAAISPDSPEQLRPFVVSRGIGYPLLSDSRSELIKKLNLLDDSIPADSTLFGIPYPCSFMLDAQGTIVGKYYEDDRRHRYTPADILRRNFEDHGAGVNAVAETTHLSLSAAMGRTIVTAGQRVALDLDVNLKPGLRVFARGVEGHTPLELRVEPSTTAVAHEVRYPAPQTDPTSEGAPFYTGHIRLKGSLLLGSHPDLKRLADSTGRLRINATLRFEACDERQCYPTERVPVSWIVQYAGFDRP